jgi:uncharacterized membrane protein
MSTVTLISIGTVLTVVAAIATFIYALSHRLTSSTKATLELVSGVLWMLGSATILSSLIQVRGIEFFDLLFFVLFLCGSVSLIFGIFHRGQLSGAKSPVQLEPTAEPTLTASQNADSQK